MKTTLLLLFLVCANLPALASPAQPAAPEMWPLVSGFRSESIPFPLSFAPRLPYRGELELRFAPGFSNPHKPTFFTYSFLWSFDDVMVGKPTQLGEHLRIYYAGLMHSVALEKKRKGPEPVTSVKLLESSAAAQGSSGFPEQAWCRFEVKTWDAFFTQRPMTLRVDVFQPPCAWAANWYRKVYYFEVSPRLDQPDVAAVLAPLRAALRLSSGNQ